MRIWNAHTGEVLKSWQVDGPPAFKASQFTAANSKFGRNYMEAGETLFAYTPGSNEYIGSPSGNIVVFLQWVEDGKTELRIGYPIASVSPDGRADSLPTVGENSLWGSMGDIGQSQPDPNMSLFGPSMAAYKIIKFDGKQQSTERYTSYQEWLDGYWDPTIKLCYHCLKMGGYLCYIISGYINSSKNYLDLDTDMNNVILDNNFRYIDCLPMSKHVKFGKNKSHKQTSFNETIYLFIKN